MKKIFSLIFLTLVSSYVFPQPIAEKIKTAYAVFSKDNQLNYGIASFVVTERTTGKLIFAANGNLGLVPASSLKTITSATALDVLGENYKFKTEIIYTGNISNGILYGDIIIRGNGDPTLGSSRYSSTTPTQVLGKILKAINDAGIRSITGKVLTDDAVWDSQSLPQGWIWQDIGNYYGAGTSALCWKENQFELSFKPSQTVGDNVELLDIPSLYPFLKIHNELKTGSDGTGDKVYGYSAPYTSEIYLRGTYARDLKKNIRFSLPDAALALAYDVQNILHQNNIKTQGYNTTRRLQQEKQITNLSEKILLTIESPELKNIVYHFNQKSINLYGEQMIRAMAKQSGNKISDGITFIKDYWNTKNIDKKSLNIIDGSGLSPANRVTASAMTNILNYAEKQKWYKSYLESLPVYNGMKMKSGTIGDVLAYAGYHNGYNFTIMVNNYSGNTSEMRRKIFKLLDVLK